MDLVLEDVGVFNLPDALRAQDERPQPHPDFDQPPPLPEVPIPPPLVPKPVPLDAINFTLAGRTGGTIDDLVNGKTVTLDKVNEWAQTGGPDGGKGTKDGPEPIMTGGEFLTLAGAVGAGVGVHVALATIGLEGIVASGATTIVAMAGAGVTGLVATGMLTYAGTTWLINTDTGQQMLNAATDYLVHGGIGETYDKIKTPNVTPIGPWPIEFDASIQNDNALFFSANPGDTHTILWDTPIEALAAGMDLTGHFGNNLFVLFFAP